MSNLKIENLFEDDIDIDPTALPDYTTLDFVSNDSHIYGEIMWPSSNSKKPHPCVIMLHGFPGTARNDDISHALCRIGCVVIVPHNRGAWGSQGKYLITNCIEDAKNLAEYAHTPEFAEKYDVDPNQIFLLGHSMGANSALNAGKVLDWIKGIIMLTPYDPTRYLNRAKESYFRSLLEEGKILQSDGIDAIYEDVVINKNRIYHPNAFEQVKDKNLLVFAGTYDSVSPVNEMVLPLWKLLEVHQTKAIQKKIEYPTEHGLLGRRISVIKEIAAFIDAVIS
ncbi:Alpha/beta hydrolase family protein [Treponema bryantii]|uniref:Alpha/beta hydrolase family protein n=1 Tax=Treponema bryantii TaxID=163 RepID=A0A1H9DCH2_9SPIR|nr:alpha/beta fold hydrolase [Treponema bryantii]SEQ11071.1 Alpha/beta hydrolase family protein [Treponema bryantii]